MRGEPAEALSGHRCAFRLWTNRICGAVAVCLAEGVAARDERDGFFVVHCHPAKGFADVAARGDRVGVAIGAFGIDVDEAHLNGSKRVIKITLAAVAAVFLVAGGEPLFLGAPVNVFLWFPDIGTTAAEAEDRSAHGLDGDVASEDHQVCPGNLVAVFLLDRPQEAASFVEVAVIGPAVERCETLLTSACATATVAGAVGAGAVPCHADEEAAVVAVVSGPPVLTVGHQGVEVFLQSVQVERFEGFRVVEAGAHRIGLGRILVEDLEVELVGPPVAVGPSAGHGGAMHHRAFADVISVHVCLRCCLVDPSRRPRDGMRSWLRYKP